MGGSEPSAGGKCGAMADSLHEDKAPRIDANNFEGSQVEHSRAYVDTKAECGG
jgi:hypothetical protein